MNTTRREGGMTCLQAVHDALPALAVGEEFHYLVMAQLTGFNETTVSGTLSELVRSGHLDRVRGKRGFYKRLPDPPAEHEKRGAQCTFEVVKVRADGSRIMTDEAGDLYLVTLVVI